MAFFQWAVIVNSRLLKPELAERAKALFVCCAARDRLPSIRFAAASFIHKPYFFGSGLSARSMSLTASADSICSIACSDCEINREVASKRVDILIASSWTFSLDSADFNSTWGSTDFVGVPVAEGILLTQPVTTKPAKRLLNTDTYCSPLLIGE